TRGIPASSSSTNNGEAWTIWKRIFGRTTSQRFEPSSASSSPALRSSKCRPLSEREHFLERGCQQLQALCHGRHLVQHLDVLDRLSGHGRVEVLACSWELAISAMPLTYFSGSPALARSATSRLSTSGSR